MATVNQRIPNFLGGVSQQPDKIKFPGQLRVCDNAVPDITFGLKKRPPAEFVGTLSNANNSGHWYEILRDGDEKYIVQITPPSADNTGMPIRVWDLADGTEKSLTNSSGDSVFSYLAGATAPYSVTTIQDYTLIANPNKTVAESSSTTAAPINNGNYSYARLDTVAYNTEYILYSGTAPTPRTFYRVTSVKVDRMSGNSAQGPTWDSSDTDQSRSGTLTWSFSGGAQVSGAQSDTENIEGSLQVNGTSYIASNTANFNGNSTASEDFLGYTQNYRTRYTATVTLTDGGLIKTTNKSNAEGRSITVNIEGQNYRISVEAVEPVTTYEGVSGIAFFKTPKNPDNGTISMLSILNGLKSAVNSSLSNVTAEVIGSGLFLTGTAADGVNFLGGAVNENMSVIGQKAQDISRLPAMNKHGYVAQISNTTDLDTDDYYVKFVADNGTSGAGAYEETVRPHNFAGTSPSDAMKAGFDPATMPHALINNRNGTFTFAKLDLAFGTAQNNQNYWKDREVGDNESNPFPTIVGKQITEMFFHRNRLGLIAEEQIVMSQPGQYFNLFIVSAIAASDDNPIDITVSDVKPAFINHTLSINKGVMMFSDNGQFLLFTESDIFSPKTVRLKKLASYECDASIQPVDLGTSVLFTSNVSAYARAFEATVVDDDTPPKIVEQTRVVPEFLPKDITKSSNSAAIGITTYGKKGDNTIYHYKYYDAGTTREQSAWYTWTLTGTMQHMLYTGGSFFTVTLHDGSYKLCRHEYITDIGETAITSVTITGVPYTLNPTQAGFGYTGRLQCVTTAAGTSLQTFLAKYNQLVKGGTFPDLGSKVTVTNITPNQSPTMGTFVNGIELFVTQKTVGSGNNTVILSMGDPNSFSGAASQTGTCTLTVELSEPILPKSYFIGTKPVNINSPLDTDRSLEACLDLAVLTDFRTHSTAISVAATNSTQAYEQFTGHSNSVNWQTLTDLVVVGLSGKDQNGVDVAGIVLPVDEISGTSVRVFNSGLDLGLASESSTFTHTANFAIGYKYKTTIELPTYYLNLGNNAYDTNGELRISGINFELGVSGPMEFHLTSPFSYTDANGNVTKDIDDYIQYESGIYANLSQLNTVPSELSKSVRVPIQRKNNKYNLQIQIPDPFSTAIISGSWDGNYSNKRHVRR